MTQVELAERAGVGLRFVNGTKKTDTTFR